jgi:hypothetical protein
MVDHRDEPARRWPLLAAVSLCVVLAWLGFPVWRATGLVAARSGYASAVLGLVGFAGLVALGAAGMLGAGLLWAWTKPHDPRGRGVALNASLVCYSAAVTWLVVVAVVHLWPRLVG